MKVFDISVPLHPAVPHWPGEKGFTLERLQNGNVCVSQIAMGLHTATHLDAPLHFLPDGKNLDQIPLERYLGPARVVPIEDSRSITRAELERRDLAGCDKVLFKTENSLRWERADFDREFIGLSAEGAAYLMERGIRLVGTDYLSIEAFGSDGRVHNILLGHDTVILEGLDLREVPAGDYYLMCVPLKIAGAEASPTRALLLDRM